VILCFVVVLGAVCSVSLGVIVLMGVHILCFVSGFW